MRRPNEGGEKRVGVSSEASAWRSFYDGQSGKFLADYVYGNRRTQAAMQHAIRWMPPGACRILDIGCGIGWSTWEMKRQRPEVFLLGIDISTRAIAIAQRLFSVPDLEFAVRDITEESPFEDTPFDAVIMLDVYEHVPRSLRRQLNSTLNSVLAERGVIVLTFPSVFHQRYVRSEAPHRLQPVEEELDIADVAELAHDVGGYIVHYEHVDIWHSRDYVHAVVERPAEPKEAPHRRVEEPGDVQVRESRVARVASRLNMRVTREGLSLPHRGNAALCVVTFSRDAYSETFIRAQIQRLPAQVRVLYGTALPHLRTEDGEPLAPAFTVFRHVQHSVARRIFGQTYDSLQRRPFKRFLAGNRISAVLAHYGTVGAAVVGACREARVPLVVHFHGYDAYRHDVVEHGGERYRELFAGAEAIIAVSRDMVDQLERLGAPRKKLHYNPNGVDMSQVRDARPAEAPPRFLAVGRFVEKKGPHLTLWAFSKVIQSIPEARLVMVGDGYLLEPCKHLAQLLGVAHAVDFRGPLPHTAVLAAMEGARGFVQHSITSADGDSEGTPNAIKEAGASGLPVISTRHAGIPDVIIDEQTGYLVDPLDVDRMAERMIRLAREPLLAARLGRAAREQIRLEFSIETCIDRLWQIIEAAIQVRQG